MIEAESFAHHGDRKGFPKDVRHTEFVVLGWCVLRVTWEDTMVQPGYVRWAFESWRLYYDRGVLPGPPPLHLPRLA